MKAQILLSRRQSTEIQLIRLVFILMLVVCPSWALGFQFYVNGQPASQNIQQTDLIKSVESKSVKVHDIHEDREIRFTGLPLRSLIAHCISGQKQKWDQIQFLSADGYKLVFDKRVVELYDGYLAYSREGQDTFNVVDASRNNRVIDLAPYYMVWNNIKNPELVNETGSLWAYQVIGLDLINFEVKYSNMVPPKPMSESVRRGFAAFSTHCANCHTINGIGGSIGPELNNPINSTKK